MIRVRQAEYHGSRMVPEKSEIVARLSCCVKTFANGRSSDAAEARLVQNIPTSLRQTPILN